MLNIKHEEIICDLLEDENSHAYICSVPVEKLSYLYAINILELKYPTDSGPYSDIL